MSHESVRRKHSRVLGEGVEEGEQGDESVLDLVGPAGIEEVEGALGVLEERSVSSAQRQPNKGHEYPPRGAEGKVHSNRNIQRAGVHKVKKAERCK